MAGKERWPERKVKENTGDRKREVAGKERWPEKKGGRKREVAGKER